MPELPDLCLYAENLRKHVLNKPIAQVEANPYKVSVTPAVFREALLSQTITDISRDGKELFFTCENGNVFAVHLMLNGKFSLADWGAVIEMQHKIVALRFEDDEGLVVTDFSGLCRVGLNPPRPVAPDALSDAFTFEYFEKVARRNKSKGVKAFLIDQKIIRGIGNAYADEILYHANISPKAITGKIPGAELRVLYEAIGWVLRDAVRQLESICPDAISGEERSFLRVHRRELKETADGEPILRENIDKKSTYYTKKQRMFW